MLNWQSDTISSLWPISLTSIYNLVNHVATLTTAWRRHGSHLSAVAVDEPGGDVALAVPVVVGLDNRATVDLTSAANYSKCVILRKNYVTT